MIKILITLTVFVALFSGGYYYFIYRDNNIADKVNMSGFLSKLNFLKDMELSKKSEEMSKTAQDIKVKTGDILAGLSKAFSSTIGKVSSTVSLIDEEVQNNKLIKLISVLDTGKSSGSGADYSTGTEKEVGVCANLSSNQQTTYLIEDPFGSSEATSTYIIDWGDGGVDKKIFTTGTVQVSHTYIYSGEFITRFKVENEKSFSEVSRRVCVK